MQSEIQDKIELPTQTNIVTYVLNNKLIRVVLAALFFLFIYKIVYHIFTFFSFDENLIKMYMSWIGVFILLVSILPQKRYSFTIKN
jgi:hypothetical protein